MTHSIKNAFMTVTVSEKGAELQSILGADGTEYLWQGDPAYWNDRALNIFPYVARLNEGKYYLDGALHHMDIHGIAPYRQFHLVSNDGTQMILELKSDLETYAQYPRNFVFRIHYTLHENTLETIYEVENQDPRCMYFGLGGHPGFNVPLTEGKRFEDYRLRFENPCHPQKVCFNEACFVTGEQVPFDLEDGQIIPLSHELFDNDAIVLTNMSRQVTLEAEGDPHSVCVTFPQMQYLGLWHWPKTDAPYVCIEPWCSLPASENKITVFENQNDLIKLDPSHTYQNRWMIQIR